ncbi:hypothetical protein [uncultured Microbulbifer sp.]|uniref:hypothetical protein n=1 Tax=uncultured Microbulbifer sp. TaxID=348147 RepID=UPI002620057D|nr:hypothetical protein [uncultured Microbulbifer sp.]
MKKRYAIGIIVFLVSAYTFAVYKIYPDKLALWINAIIAVLISSAMAVITGLLLFENQRKTTSKSEKEDLRKILKAEMIDIQNTMVTEDLMTINLPGGVTRKVLVANIQPIAMEKVALSGKFDSRLSHQLLHVARKIRMLNVMVEYFLNSIGHGNIDMINHAAGNIDSTRSAIYDNLNQIAKEQGFEAEEAAA